MGRVCWLLTLELIPGFLGTEPNTEHFFMLPGVDLRLSFCHSVGYSTSHLYFERRILDKMSSDWSDPRSDPQSNWQFSSHSIALERLAASNESSGDDQSVDSLESIVSTQRVCLPGIPTSENHRTRRNQNNAETNSRNAGSPSSQLSVSSRTIVMDEEGEEWEWERWSRFRFRWRRNWKQCGCLWWSHISCRRRWLKFSSTLCSRRKWSCSINRQKWIARCNIDLRTT